MSQTEKILAFAGSARTASWNKRLIELAVAEARTGGAEVTLIDLRDFAMPIYDADLEESGEVPGNARRLREMMIANHSLMIASPEYNSALSPLLKNILDWTSRPMNGEDGKLPFLGKTAALLSASPGAFGGFRGLLNLQSILFSLGMHVLPDMLIVPAAHQAFTPEGTLAAPRQQEALARMVRKHIDLTRRLRALA